MVPKLTLSLVVVMLDEDEEGGTLLIPTPIEPSEKPVEAARMPSGDGGVTSSLAPSPPGTQRTSPYFAARQSLPRQTTMTTTASFSSLNSEAPIEPSEKPAEAARMPSGDGGANSVFYSEDVACLIHPRYT